MRVEKWATFLAWPTSEVELVLALGLAAFSARVLRFTAMMIDYLLLYLQGFLEDMYAPITIIGLVLCA